MILKRLYLWCHIGILLLIDSFIDIKNDEYAIGLKNVTINEPFFVGHFPGKKVMPGVLIVESMAQTSGALVVSSFGKKAMGSLFILWVLIKQGLGKW